MDEDDDGLPADQVRRCGRCREDFESIVQRGRPTFVPLFCSDCDEIMANELQWREHREKLNRKTD
jgi:hypothetical protein